MKVLFVLQSISYGGSMTSMINLLSLLKLKEEIQIDALIMDPYGELYEKLEEEVRICNNNVLEAITITRDKLLKIHRYDLYLLRIIISLLAHLKHISTIDYGYKIAAKKISGEYDCIIAFQESIATDFVRQVTATKKIAWVHNDYMNVLKIYGSKIRLQEVYSTFDKIVCVSKAGCKNFQKNLGLSKDNICCIYNTLLSNVLIKKSEIVLNECLKDIIIYKKVCDAFSENTVKLVSSGRLDTQKRFDRVIDTAVILKNKGYKFVWFILGNGRLYKELESEIKMKRLEKYVILTGGLDNPFPIIKKSDIFVLTSDFEAHPMVANEALILGKPVISTNFESAKEIIIHNENGLLSDMNPESIANCIEKFITNRTLFKKIVSNVQNFRYSNEKIIRQVIEIIQ